MNTPVSDDILGSEVKPRRIQKSAYKKYFFTFIWLEAITAEMISVKSSTGLVRSN
ncbi:hypothetical protein G9G63_23325 [Paenibacillus sp. EKM202P]|uniref:hypothetical protein n=1 Tax=unclassified Paenibacillus TaxID=185978 RepID=UPI0013EC2612|nr:hypothetical protein [Paenibacillus sp. EKM202P]KAF6560002.1 hypothetical protein G9G63_23325 [Paenibacillus sp. EKM202P]KAF6564419.1 hypothetical protein G9G64_23045 [Paenibacillus sp. EKM207P]MCV9948912.1 hypothetical protein [Paenibacillus sp. BT-177]